MCPESIQDELAQPISYTVRVVAAERAKVLAADSPLFFDISLPPAGSKSSHQ